MDLLELFSFLHSVSAAKTKWSLHCGISELSLVKAGDVMWCKYRDCLNGGLKMEEFFVKN